MLVRPIILAVVAAMLLPGAVAEAGSGASSIARLRMLEAARARALKGAQDAEAKKAAAALEKKIKAAQKKQGAAAKEANVPGFGPMKDRRTVALEDHAYQAAVKANNFRVMDKILGDNLVVVLGDGKTVTRTDLLSEAQSRTVHYERQDEVPGTASVRVWGTTAVVTAMLWVKGAGPRGAFDAHLWFSNTYMKTADGWRYVFGQTSLPLPAGAVPHTTATSQ